MGLELLIKRKVQETLASSFGIYKDVKEIKRERSKKISI